MSEHKAGIWIDHRRALIVKLAGDALAGDAEHIVTILSNAEKHAERAGDSPLKGSYEAAQVAPEDRQQRALAGELARYYDSVVAAVHDAESILILGPGAAKGELHKRLEQQRLGARVAALETADKMSERQFAARVREYFSARRP